jgi:5-methylcytosine-specific restriction endonuclease McrA
MPHTAWSNGQYRRHAIEILGGKCKNCTESNFVLLQVDHIMGADGLKCNRLYHWIINNPEEAKKKYQILCIKCHKAKNIVDLQAKIAIRNKRILELRGVKFNG